jgi:quercetin dioxygenase-like cupin family protein
MTRITSLLSILVFVQAAASLTEQDAIVSDVMKGSRTIAGQTIEYPKTNKAEINSVRVDIPPGRESGRHMHPFPTYVHVLEGMLTVEFEDGSRQSFKAGSGFLEGVNTWLNVKNLEETPLRYLTVIAGEEGKSNFVRPEKHKTSR